MNLSGETITKYFTIKELESLRDMIESKDSVDYYLAIDIVSANVKDEEEFLDAMSDMFNYVPWHLIDHYKTKENVTL